MAIAIIRSNGILQALGKIQVSPAGPLTHNLVGVHEYKASELIVDDPGSWIYYFDRFILFGPAHLCYYRRQKRFC